MAEELAERQADAPAVADQADVAPPGGGSGAPTGDEAAVADRRSAFAAGPPPVPKRALFWLVAIVVAAVAIVTVLNRFVTHAPSHTLPLRHLPNGSVSGVTAPDGPTALHASLSSLLGLTPLHSRRAPALALTDAATGQRVSLASLRGRVVVLSFADANCKDICPVLASELHQAGALLGPSTPVSFVTVNADPLETTGTRPAILGQPALASLTGWEFLTGSIAQLNPVWKAYGISITVNSTNRRVSHNDVLYFISPNGTLAWSAIPFADEAKDGTFSLPAPVATRFATGIAHFASRLASQP